MVQLAVSLLRLARAPAFVGILAAVLVEGCALAPLPKHSEVLDQALPKGTIVPPAWKAEVAPGAVADDWLKALNDPQLEAIVAEAIANNLDLREAVERVTIAQQSVVVVGAQLLPHVGAVLGGRTTNDEGHASDANVTLAFAGVTWELDVWGKLRAQRAAAVEGYAVTALEYAYARQSLVATVCKTWYLATETRQLLALAEQAVEVYGQLLQLVTNRRQAGKDSDLDVVDTQAKLATAMSALEQARESYGEARRALEVLLGRYPAAEIEVAAAYPMLPLSAAAGAPASLLERRPDVIAAERALLAAFRQEEAAKLALLPSFSLSLIGGRLGDPILSVLHLNPWLASAAIGASIPIYEGGTLRAQVKIATAQEAQAIARYGSVALKAFSEVENALANERLLAKRVPLDQSAVMARTEAVRIATVQYKAGRRDVLWVSQIQAGQLANEADLIKLEGLQRVNRIQLYLALGGSFDAVPATTVQQNDGAR